METALRALGVVGVDLAFVTETKLMDGIYTRFSSDYHVLATNAVSHTQGEVALVYRDSPFWQAESVVLHGPNVISAEINSQREQEIWHRWGVYPSERLSAALDRFASRWRQVILVSNLNIKSRPDYFLGTDRRMIRKYKSRDPRHFVTYHKLVCGYLISNELKENKNIKL